MEVAARAYKKAGVDNQREQLVLDHMEYAQQVIGSMTPNLPAGVDIDNLQGAGLLGLIEAAGNYDSQRGVSFKTFAFQRIRGAVVDELRRNSPLPQKLLKQISQIREAIEKIEPPVLIEEISKLTGMDEDQVEECMAAMKVGAPQSWDEIGGFTSQHGIAHNDDPAIRAEHEETISRMADHIQQLPERERNVLIMYYMDNMLLKEIGIVLGISESRTSRVLTQAEFRLRQLMEV